jgi:hypothetical protein
VIPVKRYRHSGGGRNLCGEPNNLNTAFAGMTPEGLLKGLAQFSYNILG